VPDAIAERAVIKLAHQVFVHQVVANAFDRMVPDERSGKLVHILQVRFDVAELRRIVGGDVDHAGRDAFVAAEFEVALARAAGSLAVLPGCVNRLDGRRFPVDPLDDALRVDQPVDADIETLMPIAVWITGVEYESWRHAGIAIRCSRFSSLETRDRQ
jgi:hypothetical protein